MNQLLNILLIGLNHIGSVFCQYTAGVLAQSTLLIIILFVVDLLLRRRVRAVFRYCIWMLVLVKLILPPTLSLPTGIGSWTGSYLPAPVTVVDRPFGHPGFESTDLSAEMPPVRPSQERVGNDSLSIPVNTALTPLTWRAILFLFWIVGVLAFLVLLMQRIHFVRGLVSASRPAEESLLSLLAQCRRQVGLHGDVSLRLSETIPSPAVCGLLSPTVLIPAHIAERLSSAGMRAILIHELAHIKRSDLWVNSVQTLLQVIYFYNPFVWYANAIIRKSCEEAVDETVLVTLAGEAKDYSNTLIDIGEMAFGRADLGLRLIGVAESKKALKWRIRHMLNRPIPKSPKLGVLGMVMLLVFAAVLLPMARAEKVNGVSDSAAVESEQQPVKSIHEVAADGDLEQIKLLLAQGLHVDTRDEKGMTPLHLAPEKGHKDVVEYLIFKGASIDAMDKGGKEPVWFAMENEQRAVVDLLIQKGAEVPPMSLAAYFGDTDAVGKFIREGADVNTRGKKGRTALHWAVANGYRDTVELLIKNGADIAARTKAQGTALHIAASNAQKEMVVFLIAQGADVTAKQRYGYTPLHAAVWGESVDVVAVLIDAGADMYAEDEWGERPLGAAVSRGNTELVALFIAKGMDPNSVSSNASRWEGWTVLHRAAISGSKEVMQLLLSKGADVNCKGKDGDTPIQLALGESGSVRTEIVRLLVSHGADISALYAAAFLGEVEKVKTVINEGADVNANWLDCGTALHAAARGNQKDVAELLIAQGADVNAGLRDGDDTPLIYAAVNGCKEVARLLIEKGADIHAGNSGGFTPIYAAAVCNNKPIIDLLLSKGADIDAKETRGMTALHHKAWQADSNMMEFLLSRSAHIEARTKSGTTPLFFAVQCGKLEAAQFLLSKGANVNMTDNNSKTPLSVAREKGNAEMIELLLKHGGKE